MTNNLAELAKELTGLPVASRTYLVDCLVESLEEAVDPVIEKAWLEEADRRWQAIADGSVQCIQSADAMRKAYQSLKK